MCLELAKYLHPSLFPTALIGDEMLHVIWALLYPADKCWQKGADPSSRCQMSLRWGLWSTMPTRHWTCVVDKCQTLIHAPKLLIKRHHTQRAAASFPNFGFPEFLLLPSIWSLSYEWKGDDLGLARGSNNEDKLWLPFSAAFPRWIPAHRRHLGNGKGASAPAQTEGRGAPWTSQTAEFGVKQSQEEGLWCSLPPSKGKEHNFNSWAEIAEWGGTFKSRATRQCQGLGSPQPHIPISFPGVVLGQTAHSEIQDGNDPAENNPAKNQNQSGTSLICTTTLCPLATRAEGRDTVRKREQDHDSEARTSIRSCPSGCGNPVWNYISIIFLKEHP